MKIVVIGGSGLIGANLVGKLREKGHEVVAASPSKGVNALTGEGLAGALAGADVVVDVANSPSFDDRAVLAFFESSTRNLLAAEAAAGVRHHVVLSIVGVEGLPESGYFRAKVAQEKLVVAGAIPWTILRATQFFEFVGAIAESCAADGAVRLPDADFQPVAADDVAAALAEIAAAPPANAVVDLGGPERLPMSDFAKRLFAAKKDARPVSASADARYFGAPLQRRSLTAGDDARAGPTRFEDWLRRLPA
jgi:uncharacterized protein YbjT (DUF2867 family)